LTITSATAKSDAILIKGVENPEARKLAKRVKALVRKRLIGFGLPVPLYLQVVPPGRSFHSGGSFPMGGQHPVFSSDLLGRPAGLKRVHIVDSACFPSIASSTIGFTIMANADRISRASAELSS
jgi:choline dehydrogenase-like flavoprotein